MKHTTKKSGIFFALIALLLMTSLLSCSASKRGDSYDSNSSMGAAGEDLTVGGPSNDISDKAENAAGTDAARKIIYTAAITLETKAFDEDIQKLKALAVSLGGYVEQSSQNGRKYSDDVTQRYASFTFRIPQQQFDAFGDGIGEICNVLHSSTSSKDITESYYDAEARLGSLRAQETKLLSMYEEAKTLEEMLLIEDKLTDVRYQIESLERTLMSYDSAVSYSTFEITVNEVKEYTEPAEKGWGERIADAFVGGFSIFASAVKEISIILVYLLPWICVAAAVVVVVLVIAKKKK